MLEAPSVLPKGAAAGPLEQFLDAHEAVEHRVEIQDPHSSPHAIRLLCPRQGCAQGAAKGTPAWTLYDVQLTTIGYVRSLNWSLVSHCPRPAERASRAAGSRTTYQFKLPCPSPKT